MINDCALDCMHDSVLVGSSLSPDGTPKMFPAFLRNVLFLLNKFLIERLDHRDDDMQLTSGSHAGEKNK